MDACRRKSWYQVVLEKRLSKNCWEDASGRGAGSAACPAPAGRPCAPGPQGQATRRPQVRLPRGSGMFAAPTKWQEPRLFLTWRPVCTPPVPRRGSALPKPGQRQKRRSRRGSSAFVSAHDTGLPTGTLTLWKGPSLGRHLCPQHVLSLCRQHPWQTAS